MAHMVYRNLTNGLLSIKDTKTNLVLAHCEQVVLSNAHTIVKESGRQYVVRTGKKIVHAYVIGEVVDVVGVRSYKGRTLPIPQIGMYQKDLLCTDGISITYNPFKYNSFVNRNTGDTVAGVVFRHVHLCSNGSVTAY